MRSYRDNEDRVGEQLQIAENYLGLVGYVMVVLGGIGVWSVTRVFIQQKLQSIAVLKCVGATVAQVLAVYVAAGAAARRRRQPDGPRPRRADAARRADERLRLARRVSVGLTLSAGLQALGIGVLVSLLFALVPLLEVRRVRPLLCCARRLGARRPAPRARRRRAPLGAAIDPRRSARGSIRRGPSCSSPCSWPAGRRRRGGWASSCRSGSCSVAIALHLVGLAVVRRCGRSAACSGFRCVTRSIGLGRPGHQTG